MMSANALAAIGPDAASATEARIAAGMQEGEDARALRSLAEARGAIARPLN